jgi:putative drug exporter of the RND superfamily
VKSMAAWCVRHRRHVVVIWLLVLVVTVSVSRAWGSDYTNDFTLSGTPSTEAMQLIKSVSPAASGDVEQIVFATSNGATITSPPIRARILATLDAVAQLPKIAYVDHVPEITAPVSGGVFRVNPAYVSASGTVALATVNFAELGQNVKQATAAHFISVATSHATSNLQIAVEGQIAEDGAKPAIGGLIPGAIAALIVLLLVFGSLFAALMPLASALVALGSATAVIDMLTHVLKLAQFAPELVILIGLGVGVDYALFIVSRHRQGLTEGLSVEDAIVNAVNTSGRAVFFAGIIVCVALLGMFALGVTFLYGLAIAASLAVAFTMVAALTLLPAILGFVGHRIFSRPQRKKLASSGPLHFDAVRRTFWDRWSRLVDRGPVIPAVLALIVIGLLASPFFSIQLGSSDAGNDPAGTTTRVAYDLLAQGFGPGFNGPLEIVARVDGPADQAAVTRIVAAVRATPGVAAVEAAFTLPDKAGGTVELVNAYPTTSPQAAATTQLITTLRDQVIPSALGTTKMTVLVGGITAIFADFATVLASKLPLFIGSVVFVSFLLLALVFRSLVVPLLSAAMNLLSIGAAFGILTAVFQWGWLGGLVGVNQPGPVESFLPVMMFAILFGLSMDYQVFLVTRMHEEWRRCGDNRTAVRLGLARTGKTITAAAAIMIVVFASFILGGERVIKEFGLGLSGGILVDALVIRMCVVPATMFLFGRANWWFPAALDRRLPKFGLEHHEGERAP